MSVQAKVYKLHSTYRIFTWGANEMSDQSIVLEKLNSTERAMMLQFDRLYAEIKSIKESQADLEDRIGSSETNIHNADIRLTKLESSTRTAARLGWSSIGIMLTYIAKVIFEHKT